jgi:hypothetical protein
MNRKDGAKAAPRRFRRGGAGLSVGGMNDSGKSDQKARQQRRLSTALRENLKRRKVQARGRDTADAAERGGGEGAPHDSAGFGADKRER